MTLRERLADWMTWGGYSTYRNLCERYEKMCIQQTQDARDAGSMIAALTRRIAERDSIIVSQRRNLDQIADELTALMMDVGSDAHGKIRAIRALTKGPHK